MKVVTKQRKRVQEGTSENKTKYEHFNTYMYITNENVILPSQHGFQPGYSPCMPLISMQEQISSAAENNEYSIGIFFDLAKVSVTVNHASTDRPGGVV